MLMRITFGDTVVAATLDNNPTARDFHSLLPLAVTLEDYAGTEKIAYLSRKLSTSGAPEGVVPVAGDLAYYAPWGNLAIFYRDFRYSPGLIRLGRISSSLEALRFNGSVQARMGILNG
jgi:hypothetical protein